MLLFIYGTLLDPSVLQRVTAEAGLARSALAATAMDWRRVVLRGTPWPTLARLPGARTDGRLIRPSPAAFARIVAYEGAPYRLVPIAVVTHLGVARARAFVAPERLAELARCWPEGEERPAG